MLETHSYVHVLIVLESGRQMSCCSGRVLGDVAFARCCYANTADNTSMYHVCYMVRTRMRPVRENESEIIHFFVSGC